MTATIQDTAHFYHPVQPRELVTKMPGDSLPEVWPYRQVFIGAELPGQPKVIMFLHGAGERGQDNSRQMINGVQELIAYCRDMARKVLLLVPQCPEEKQWVDTPWYELKHSLTPYPSAPLSAAMELLRVKQEEFTPQAAYLIGLSMGGYGVWDWVTRSPQQFQAAIAICGGGDISQAERIRNLPILVAHGRRDSVVPVQRSRDMVQALWNQGGQQAIYQEFPEVGHNAWTPIFSHPDTWHWLFSN